MLHTSSIEGNQLRADLVELPPIETALFQQATITEEVCERCKGTGYVPNDAPWLEYEPVTCEDCRGAEVIRRDYLREAFLIVQDRCHLIPERKHLEAVIAHCRQFVSAAISLPEVN
jgi:hypothetical protein